MQRNGWRLFVHPLFELQLEQLVRRVERLAAEDTSRYKVHPASKLLATIRHYLLEAIPRDPDSPEFRQGNTLGPDNRHWFRAKLHNRYRLFYRFSSREKVIIYVWVNDDRSLGIAGSRIDPYWIFRSMLEAGEPPDSFEDLLLAAKELADERR